MEKELTLVTVTHQTAGGFRAWDQYLDRVESLLNLYSEDAFNVLILDNTSDIEIRSLRMKAALKRFKNRSNVTYAHESSLINCRNSTYKYITTSFIAILDDDDILTSNFLNVFQYLRETYPDCQLFNLRKLKIGGTYNLVSKDRLISTVVDKFKYFYRYEDYQSQKMSSIYYPINGFNIIRSDLYEELETTESICEDCGPMTKAYLLADEVVLSSIVWQFYYSQNKDISTKNSSDERLLEVETSLYNQMSLLLSEFSDQDSIPIIYLQIENLIKAINYHNPNYTITKLINLLPNGCN